MKALASLLVALVTGTLLCSLPPEAPINTSDRALTLAERVAYQYAIEDVYWRQRIWPKERPDSKPPLDAVMSQAQLEKKVADYLRDSQALEASQGLMSPAFLAFVLMLVAFLVLSLAAAVRIIWLCFRPSAAAHFAPLSLSR